MKIRRSREQVAELQALAHACLAAWEQTCRVLRDERRRRGWTDADIDAALKEPPPCP